MEYNDSLLRPTRIIPPSGAGQTVMEYGDTVGSLYVKTKTQIDSVNWAESTVYADGLGRAVKSEKKDNGGNVFTETQYDAMGRAFKTSNPYRAGDTLLWTQSTFDDLGRVVKIKTPDNAEVNTSFDLATSGTLGSVVTATDQAGKTRRSITNALGQLARVDEPDDSGNLGTVSNPNQSTAYSYDTLNNLTTVNQGVQTRTFAYNNLSRLLSAANPESGTISYTYDANGNLTGKTDARSIATAYGYDNLNRVLTRTYSDSTPAVSYYYDGTGLGSVPSYAKGKLTRVSSSVSDSRYNSFDNTGKVLSSQQITDGNTYTYGFAYSYNLAGMLLEETYPSGRVVRNTIATDASLSKVETQPYGGSYATRADSFSYTAAGAVSLMMLGNSRWENAQFNSRLQPTQLGLGTSSSDQSLWKVAYDYGTSDNNGNVKSQTITVPSINPLVQTYAYDSLNRIKSAIETQNSTQTWKQTFTYDRYGNRNFDAAGTTTIPSGCSTAQCNPSVDTNNNRFTTGQGYTYDLSGNIVTDAQGRTFAYDAENKQKTVSDAGGTIGTYLYDGDGKRVKKVSSVETTLFVYDASGKMTAEYLLTSSMPTNPTTSYLTNDNLGSPRIITDSSGNITSRRDFMPFGEEIAGIGNRTSAIGYQADSIRQKFTGYERDSESDLDFAQARMYSHNMGRFQNPDNFKKDTDGNDPKSWNLYIYVRDNPINFIDPTGERGDYYDRANGQYLGTDGKNDHKVYVGTPIAQERKGSKLITYWDSSTLETLPITDVEFLNRGATIYGESSAVYTSGATDNLRLEMMGIAYVHLNNKKAYADKSEQAGIFRNTSIERRTEKMQLANLALINSLTGGPDPSNGATMWDGAEQAQFPESDTRGSTGKWELHMNTMGWSISDENYTKWKENVGDSFKAPQIRVSPRNYPEKGYYNKGRTMLHSTAVYGRTIFWREEK